MYNLNLAEEAGLPDGIYIVKPKIQMGKFWRALEWRILLYFMPIWNML
jgi:hypothetical protein